MICLTHWTYLHAGYNPYHLRLDIYHIAKAFLILDHSSGSNGRLGLS